MASASLRTPTLLSTPTVLIIQIVSGGRGRRRSGGLTLRTQLLELRLFVCFPPLANATLVSALLLALYEGQHVLGHMRFGTEGGTDRVLLFEVVRGVVHQVMSIPHLGVALGKV